MSTDPQEKQQEDVIIKCKPQPYVICRAGKNENYIRMEDTNGVMLLISFLDADYVMSEPTGKTNFAVCLDYLQKYTPPKEQKSAAAMLKERDQQM